MDVLGCLPDLVLVEEERNRELSDNFPINHLLVTAKE